MLTRLLFRLNTLLLAVPIACGGVEFQVELTPDADGVARVVTSQQRGEPLPEPFSQGHLESVVPDDLGGAGFHHVLASPAGSIRVYVERTRGAQDPWGQIDRIEAAADGLCELAIVWLGEELSDQPAWEEIRAAIQGPVKRSLKNFALELWAGTRVGGWTWEASMARLTQWLLEQDLVRPEELVELFETALAESPQWPLGHLRIAELLEEIYDDAELDRESLRFLATNETFLASLDRLATDADYLRLMRRWRRQRLLDFRKEPVAPHEFLDAGLEGLLTFPSFLDLEVPDSVTFLLECPAEPEVTNGQWDARESVTRWTGTLVKDGPPGLFYAVWTAPDEAWQAGHFGRVLLRNRELVLFVYWSMSLSETRRVEWNLFLDGLRPSEDLAENLGAFRFSDDTEGDADYGGVSELIELLGRD